MSSILTQLSPGLRQTVAEIGFETLTPIQEQSIPALLAGRDVIGQSRTGSGKTAAFVLPILDSLAEKPRRVQALILCPTRELCAQVAREFRKFGRRMPGLQVLVVAGGQPFKPQALALQGGVHVVVGTPGRVLDHLERRTLTLGFVSTLVLDEADRMLDMGFEEDMRAILEKCPKNRRTALFSATYPPAIDAMSRSCQRDPVRITIKDDDGDPSTASAPPIRQLVMETFHDDKAATLLWLLRDRRPESCIVFCNLKVRASELATALDAAGVSASAIHGDLEQRDRDRVMAQFRNRSVRVLIATDVAARGLDVEAVDLVVNFDLPSKPESYVHRIGRTGRAGRSGVAVALATPKERHKIEAIEAYTSVSLQPLKPGEDVRGAAPAAVPSQEAAMATLKIGGGRKGKIRPGDILGALTGEAGRLPADAVGKIEIHDYFAYVAVRRDLARSARDSLMAGRIKGRKLGVEFVV